jgi:nitrate reductase NapD
MSEHLNVSGIAVVARPSLLQAASLGIEALPGVEIMAVDPGASKLVVVQELPAVEDHIAGLRTIQALPGVLTADLVYHYFESTEDTESAGALGARPSSELEEA